jgi:hypothetical protein
MIMSLLHLLRPLSVALWLSVLALLCTPSAALPATSSSTPPSALERRGGNACRERNFNTINTIYNLTVWPNQLPVFQNGTIPTGLFNDNVTGRVDPVGTFQGLQDSIEYFFALSPLPTQNGVSAAITGYQITEFTSECADVASSVVYLFSTVVNPGAPNDGQVLPTLKQVAFWKFDECGAVLKYDAWIPNLNDWVTMATGSDITDTKFQANSVLGLCAMTQLRCTGADQQWADLGACIDGLSAKPYGNYDEAWGDNIVCRFIHVVLTQIRPDVSVFHSHTCRRQYADIRAQVHCQHVGPTGGGKCVNLDYNDQYFQDQALYGDPLGQTFMCT